MEITGREEEAGMRKPVEVRNADIPLLADVSRLIEEIRQTEKDLEWARERMRHIRSPTHSGSGGGGRVPRGLDEGFAALAELEDEYNRQLKACTRQLRRAKRIIEDIESRSMRTFVRMKYVSFESDKLIMKSLGMSRRGFARARNAVENAPCMSAVKWQERYILTSEC